MATYMWHIYDIKGDLKGDIAILFMSHKCKHICRHICDIIMTLIFNYMSIKGRHKCDINVDIYGDIHVSYIWHLRWHFKIVYVTSMWTYMSTYMWHKYDINGKLYVTWRSHKGRHLCDINVDIYVFIYVSYCRHIYQISSWRIVALEYSIK